MGISRDSRHKHRLTGGRRNIHQKKRKFELGRQPASTKIGAKRVNEIRVRGGNTKFRALRLDSGNFSWGTECCTRRVRILDVVYNASNNELVRTKTLVKNAIVQVDATAFRQFYEQHYGIVLGKKKKETKEAKESKDASAESTSPTQEKKEDGPVKKSHRVLEKLKARSVDHVLDPHLKDQFNSGRLLACISSRPGQSGRADGYILEAKELEFYIRRMQKKK